jgi:hypothetical protein
VLHFATLFVFLYKKIVKSPFTFRAVAALGVHPLHPALAPLRPCFVLACALCGRVVEKGGLGAPQTKKPPEVAPEAFC